MSDRLKAFISQHSLAIILSLFGLAGAAVIWINTPWGIGVGYDSIFYLSAADNLLTGLGLSRLDGYGNIIPLTHFPPFYSLSVAGLSFLTGFETDLSARILAAVLFGVLIGLVGWLIYYYTKSLLACALGASLVLVSPVILDISFMAMSELMYLAALILMIHILNRYLITTNIWVLITAAALTAVMYLTRYVGISALVFGVIALLIFGQRTLVKKIKDVILFAVISFVPVFIYYIRNWILTGSMTNRVIRFHPPTEVQLRQGLSTITAWLIPTRIDATIRVMVLITFVLVILLLFLFTILSSGKKSEQDEEDRGSRQFVYLLGIYAVIYVLMVGLSLTFFDASTRLNDRILSPIYVIGIIVGLVVVWSSNLIQHYPWVRVGVVILSVAFVGLNFLRAMDVADGMRNEGRGFSGKQWRSSETIANLSQLSPDVFIFTNEAFAVYYLSGISANWIPENFDPVKGQGAKNYDQKINDMLGEISDQDGALVIFNSLTKTNVYAPVDQLTVGLSLLATGTDGAIYVSP